MPLHPRTSSPSIDSKIRKSLPRLYAWYRRHHRPLPWRRNPTPYHVTVSEFMAQQTRMAVVIPYYDRWIRRFPNWSSLAQAPRRVVLRQWEGLGYYRRAGFLHELARSVINRYRGRIPSDPETLRTLPGIGDYTAGAIASIAFNVKAPSFDGNVARVLGRLTTGPRRPRDTKHLRNLADRLVPKKEPGIHNQALMELGALVCLPKHPLCPTCPFQRNCPTAGKKIPPSPTRPKPIPVEESILVIRRGSSVWLTRYHPQGRWQGLWLLPTTKKPKSGPKPVHRISYPYTRYKITAGVYHAPKATRLGQGRWFRPPQLKQATLPAPHRKILKLLEMG